MPVTLSPNDEGSDPPVSLFLRLVDDRVVCRYQVEFVVGADSWMMLGCFFVVSYGNRYWMIGLCDCGDDDGDVGGLFVFLFRVVFLKTGVPTLLTVRATIGRWTLNSYADNLCYFWMRGTLLWGVSFICLILDITAAWIRSWTGWWRDVIIFVGLLEAILIQKPVG